jgi:hypothetical protein
MRDLSSRGNDLVHVANNSRIAGLDGLAPKSRLLVNCRHVICRLAACRDDVRRRLNEGGPTMAHRRPNPCVIALAAALTIGLSSGSRAQSADSTKRATPMKSAATAAKTAATKATSAKRIKVKKDSAAGEVALPKRTDTAVVAADTTMRADTTARVDSMTRPDSVARPDSATAVVDTSTKVTPVSTMDTTTANAPPTMRRRHFGSFYVGLAGGTSVPSGDVYNGYNPGFNVSIPMGWQPSGSLFGLRLDVAYDRLTARSAFRNNGQSATRVTLTNGTYTTGGTPATASGGTASTPVNTGGGYYNGVATIANADAALASAMLDGKLTLPVFGSRSPASLYAVAGGGLHYFLNYAKTLALTNPAAEQAKFAALHQAVTAAAASGLPYSTSTYSNSGYSAVTRLGANGGAGIQWAMGASDLFLEVRYVTVFTKDRSTNYWPIVLGVTWR